MSSSPDCLKERSPVLVGVGHDGDVAVRRAMGPAVRRHDSAVARTLTGDRGAGEVLYKVEGKHRVEHRDLHLLPLAGAITVNECGEHAVGDHDAGDLVANEGRHERGDAKDLFIERREVR